MSETASSDAAIEQFQRWTHLMGRAQQAMLEFWTRQDGGSGGNPDPLGMFNTWTAMANAAAANPAKLFEAQTALWQDSVKLWSAFLSGKPEESPVAAAKDKRFASPAWRENPAFEFMRQSYLLSAQHVMESVGALEGLGEHDRAKAMFLTKQFVDAMSPSNFALTNPDVLSATVETQGENLMKGLENLLQDLENGRMRMVDEDAFEVGRNVAVTPGKVVFENRMFQLIQYAPTTETVFETPLVIFPPWINKFYILDLTAEKSFIRWAVEQGLTVFVVSWANPNENHADVVLDTYVTEGILTAIDKVIEATGAPSVNTIGYCVAGTTLAATLAYLAATKQAAKVNSVTFFTAQVDFSNAGELNIFVDDEQLANIEALSKDKGYLDGRHMATTFNLLRSNDLIWNYVVNNYMMGKDYLPFDLLYWNSDATNVPCKWHQSYLRDLYRDNKLVQPGGVSIAGVPIDLTKVKTPAYIQAGKEDHIAPAKSVFEITHHFKGPMRFVLAGSGHIAGVVNPPSQGKYQHWVSDAATVPPTLDEFVASAKEVKGSWWPDWIAWLAPRSGDKVPARVPGKGKLKAIEDAPGRYVKVRI
ncbi:PHA/PHB synthase family protein [Sphingoaurantiacus capsulatus]|uniref:PHA/PHB synthase family protein n=1 Tax=Sphingoaurantiacus capsulatus TaxID=1771310 RepID=A0ABV7XFP6_9SPHN